MGVYNELMEFHPFLWDVPWVYVCFIQEEKRGKLLGNWLLWPDRLNMFLYTWFYLVNEPILHCFCWLDHRTDLLWAPFSIRHSSLMLSVLVSPAVRWVSSQTLHRRRYRITLETVLDYFNRVCCFYFVCDCWRIGSEILGRATPVLIFAKRKRKNKKKQSDHVLVTCILVS